MTPIHDTTTSGAGSFALRGVEFIVPDGLHLRAAARLARAASAFDAEVRVRCDGREAGARSILDLLTLAAAYGCHLELDARGADAEAAAQALADLAGTTRSDPRPSTDPQPDPAVRGRGTAGRGRAVEESSARVVRGTGVGPSRRNCPGLPYPKGPANDISAAILSTSPGRRSRPIQLARDFGKEQLGSISTSRTRTARQTSQRTRL